ncbi:receptor activity-modifying protein 3 isoform X1 [Oryzias melastigma]|uniref:Receptor activity-modifying protein 3-like n=2 Tax=Oryzias melastigma TaxID=30732 RepID=A0A3B3DV11_ORYME|nr:receptor activity-modifying protein 3 isoform X1 [Oryzias melastigma]
MIFYLLLAALSLGSVALQQANITQGSLGKVMAAFSKENRTMKTTNVTSAVSEEDLTKLEDQIHSNQTSPVVTEDDERFQDQEFVLDLSPPGCDRKRLIHATDSICADRFHKDMQDLRADDWCVLEHILRPYNDMTLCVEMVTNLVGCYFPNSDVQELFLFLHSNYFHNCSEEQQFADAPQSVVLTLTIAPVSLIPVLVYLVIRRS